MPAPCSRHACRKGSTESPPRYGVDGQRVGERRLVVARLEISGGVGAGRRADVAALAVGDHEQPGRARVAADALERGDPVGAERLEERHLRLDRDDVGADGVDDPAAEAGNGVRGLAAAEHRLAAQLDRQQVEPRIEADDELAALALDGLREPVGKGRGGHGRHGDKATRRLGTSASRNDAELRRRPAQDAPDQQELVGVGRLERRLGARDRRQPCLELDAPGLAGQQRARRDDAAAGDEERAPEAGPRRRGRAGTARARAGDRALRGRPRRPRARRSGRAAARRPRSGDRPPSRLSFARSAGRASAGSPSQSPSARAAACARRRLFSGPCGPGVSVTHQPAPRRRR